MSVSLRLGVLVLLAAGAVAGCGSSSDTAAPAEPTEGLALQVPNPTMRVGATQQATVKRMMVTPRAGTGGGSGVAISTSAPCCAENEATGITWMTFNRDIITVDAEGVVTAVGCGATNLVATMPSSDGSKVLSVAIVITVEP